MKFSKRRVAGGFLCILLFLLAAPVLSLSAGEAQRVPVLFTDAKGREMCRFEAELALTVAEQARGLMHRPYMPHRYGMLFIHDRDEMQHYWMKNVHIPLDIIFMNGSHDVVHVHHNAHPHDETTISSRHPARYILEINAGEARECKIKRGVNARFGRSALDR